MRSLDLLLAGGDRARNVRVAGNDLVQNPALLNPAMKFGVSAALRAALTPNFIAQISNAQNP